MRNKRNDDELFALARRELFTAVVGDTMDKLQLHCQFLPPEIKPLRPDMVAIGRAMTVLEEDLPGAEAPDIPTRPAAAPFGLMFDALDDLKPGEIYVCTGASPTYALWGELMSLRALKCGAAGAVLDGYARDTRGILALDFPTFAFGGYAQDQGPRGRVVDFRAPIVIGDARIAPGDLLFADVDGVCVVPRAAEEEVFAGAIEKVRGEALVRKAIAGGMSAKAAFEQYRIM